MSHARLVQVNIVLLLSHLFSVLVHAQAEPESYVAVIGRPGVVGAPSAGAKDGVVKDGPRQGATAPIRMKAKETLTAPDGGVVSLLVFSRQHEAGKTAQGSITLKPGTKATIDPAAIDKDADVLLDIEQGAVRVIKEPKSKGVFRVRTPQATMAVRGTEMWLMHTPAAFNKPASTVCAVPTGTVEVTVGDKNVAVSAGNMVEIENDRLKPAVKITADTSQMFAHFRTDPTNEKWLILDCDDADNLKLIDGGNRQTNSAILDYSPGWMSEAKAGEPKHVLYSCRIVTQPINVSAYRYLAVHAMFPTPGKISASLFETDEERTSARWFSGVANTPQRNKWQWFIFDLALAKTSDSRLLQFMEIREVPDDQKGNLVPKSKKMEIRQVMFLRELPSNMKDRIHQDKRATPKE